MGTVSTQEGWGVSFDGGSFVVSHAGGDLEVLIATPIEVTPDFESMKFEIHVYAKKELKESAIFPVHLKGAAPGGGPRIGFMIPVNALGSVDHGRAEEKYFRNYSYMAIKLALEYLAEKSPEVFESFAGETQPILFSDLFDDNVSFLVLSRSKIPDEIDFSMDRILPSLISYGYVPAASCSPAGLDWAGSDPTSKVNVSLISEHLDNPQMLSKLLVLSAVSSPSLVTQYFYFYQVFEYLMENVMRHRLPLVLQEMVTNLQGGTSSARDQFDRLGSEIRERGRLKLLVSRYSNCASDLSDFALVSQDFLESLQVESKPGIDSIYKVRNFLFHQARDLPSHDDPLLAKVVDAFSQYLPSLLRTYANPESLGEAPAADEEGIGAEDPNDGPSVL
ncbi:hypothetical protein ACX80O_04305 [Arthrobacter sp. Hz1]